MFKQLCKFGTAARLGYFASFTTKVGRPKVAVVLSGSGVYDGSEVHEVSAIAAHLTRANLEPVFYAPDIPQLDVVDHVKGSPEGNEKRNVLTESARIARGQIKPLSELVGNSADGLVLPGGFGAAKNLCDFAVFGHQCTVNSDVARVLLLYHMAKKPIAMCCIAPVIAAKVLSDSNITITLGRSDEAEGKWPHLGAITAARALGATVEEKFVNEICFDERNLLITTPAFMYNGEYHEIYDGVGLMIAKLVSMVKK